ncbi:MAG: RICIN domain-containing protein, partial [Actinomycetota bacterium]
MSSYSRVLLRLMGVLALLGAAVLPFGPAASGNGPNDPIVVTNTGDQDDTDPSDGLCQTTSQGCTLRAAITQANGNPGPDTINFNIAGTQVHRIRIGSTLPELNDSAGTTIDGYTQPGAAPNTDPLIFNAAIKIEIDGIPSAPTFIVQSAENQIRGIAMFDHGTAIEVIGENADGNVIAGNIIGTNVGNTFEQCCGIGIIVNLGPDQNAIGTPALGDRNVISGNGSYGIRMNHGGTSQNLVQNNIIGLDATGQVNRTQSIGVDLQFWTWGNQVGGTGQYEGNVIAGHNSGGMDLSHSATGNLVLGNRIGTHPDGVTISDESANQNGVIFKDNPEGNYVAYNIISGNESDGVWHKHNYTGRNTVAYNRIVNNTDFGIFVTGHDDLYYDNIVAGNGQGGVNINNTSTRNNANYPDEQTERTSIRLGHYYNNGGPAIEIEDDLAHPSQDQPTLTGIGVGEVYGGETCANCIIDIYASGSVNSDGTVTAGPAGTGGVAILSARSDLCLEVSGGSLDDSAEIVQNTCTGSAEQTFEMIPAGTGFSLRATHSNKCIGVSGASQADDADVLQVTCNGDTSQQLRWSGNSLVFAHSDKCLDVDGGSFDVGERTEQNLCTGAERQQFQPGDSINSTWLGTVTADANGDFSMASAALQQGVVVWATSLTLDGETSAPSGHLVVGASPINLGTNPSAPGPTPEPPEAPDAPPPYEPETFTCAAADDVLTWADAAADEYYVFAYTNGVETYLGGHTTTSLNVIGAGSYKVTHWKLGYETAATCDGPGPPPPFSCAAADGVLTWDDAGATEYYVFAITGGDETYLGGHTTTSLNVIGADSYKVTHWLNGETIATCDGPGPPAPVPFDCSEADGVLTWDDAEAAAYYVFAITGGDETYLGGHTTTSLNVPAADSYRVTH